MRRAHSHPTPRTAAADRSASLLDTAVMRRDPFWLIETDAGQASRLLPLKDFSPRGNEARERGYLRGRYGALPLISDIGLH